MSDDVYLGEIRAFAFPYEIIGWRMCNGQMLSIEKASLLYGLIGTTFGGNGLSEFALPDIRGRMLLGQGQNPDTSFPNYAIGYMRGSEATVLGAANLPAHTHALQCSSQAGTLNQDGKVCSPVTAILAVIQGGSLAYITTEQAGNTNKPMDTDSISSSGGRDTFNNMSPFITLNYMISTQGAYPSDKEGSEQVESYLGEVRMFAFGLNPVGWLMCDGARLQVSEYQTLFSLIGTIFGGDGKKTFNLPDLRGIVPMHPGSKQNPGQTGGRITNTLGASQMPSHNHVLNSDGDMGSLGAPQTNFWAAINTGYYIDKQPDSTMDPSVVIPAGSQSPAPFSNMPPYMAANFCICVKGLYPPKP